MQDEEFWERQKQIYKHAYVSIGIFIINVIIFIVSQNFAEWMYSDGTMVTEKILGEGEFYRIFTAMFLHADIDHICNNMAILILAGAIVENYTGHMYYAILYLLSGFFGNILSMAYEINNDLSWVSIGASGAIMGIVGFLVAWIIANRRTFLKHIGTVVRIVFLLVFVVEACFFQQGANTPAHLGGFLTGFVLGVINIVILSNNKIMEGLA
ncbi:MAG: rhomboid family intramembrane serine protease [Butyrivibrio sp.]|uniref:rhomboid family intramembrane serine protease n=1 Tax=Butyrivibrio sp. TaxID=28121 RepID=UPI001B0D1EF0|nr:rhomboid family intramembrane serine protease [Butyrivibrio sp.]MBO6240451.1 rhomboid family intramembrane serine protease [Butyrivibrio sp.]